MPEPAAKKQKKASFEGGQAVMYYSKSNEEWLEDKVEAVNKDGTLQLDQKEEANPDLCVPTEGFDAENPPDVSKALQEEADAEDDEEDLGDEDSEDEDDYDEDDEDEEEDEGGFEVFEDEDDAGVGALKLYIKDSKKPLHEEPLYAGLVKKQKVEADPDSTAEVCVSAERCPVLAIPFQSKHALTPPGSQSSSVTVVFSVGPKEVQLTLDASAVVAGACSPLSSCFNSSMLSPWVALQGRRTATSA